MNPLYNFLAHNQRIDIRKVSNNNIFMSPFSSLQALISQEKSSSTNQRAVNYQKSKTMRDMKTAL